MVSEPRLFVTAAIFRPEMAQAVVKMVGESFGAVATGHRYEGGYAAFALITRRHVLACQIRPETKTQNESL